MMQWMYNESLRQISIPEGKYGGIILDEMAIQEDLQIVHTSQSSELYGLSFTGGDLGKMQALNSGEIADCKLANHVQQYAFTGLTGFRWPFAHFPNTQAPPAEIFITTWMCIDELTKWGFNPIYCCMDGSANNRAFLKMHFSKSDPVSMKMSFYDPNKRYKSLLTMETREDLDYMYFGFMSIVDLCTNELNIELVPSRVNSDIIENIFCQERSLYHGANSNPNYNEYRAGINSIILGQSTISKKANCGGETAKPFAIGPPSKKSKHTKEYFDDLFFLFFSFVLKGSEVATEEQADATEGPLDASDGPACGEFEVDGEGSGMAQDNVSSVAR
ncbi:hypothetical protein KUTeg_012137 [Tegillarca granosa]|uniref:Transposable element P transposase-like RNase H domain-containing protein n=1 Tax=Tegillarca granosa TaxID=220873 RepID=A0ABQ9F306_TEGGR|nr:hypothetical protein KUTeg_012137 [Tegillarca granosa]